MQKVMETVVKIRREDIPVLITGETGVGKDMVAQAIHSLSNRANKGFSVLNCSSLSKEVLESQLFGHRKGSFTGAISDYPGIIRSTDGGTLFLDEIGDMDPSIQPKLLRFLQSGEVMPLGEPRARKVDLRLITATNKDLQQEIDRGNFRSDLFYRINTICVHIPPLRQRRDEIPHLIEHYLAFYSEKSGKKDVVMSQETINILTNYTWPGNIRQLCSELRRIVAFADSGDLITPEDLSPGIICSQGGLYLGKAMISQIDNLLQEHRLSLSDAVEVFEKALISRALELHSGSISPTARVLGLTRRGFKLKMKRFNITTARRTRS